MTDLELRIREANSQQGKLNRDNGLDFEFRLLSRFKKRKDVLFAIRSAGSHGLFDVIVQFKDKRQWLITCRRSGHLTPSERTELSKSKSNMASYQRQKLAYYPSSKRIKIQNI